jgi:hypothetical protein
VSSRGLFRIRKFNLKVRIKERNLLTAAKQVYERIYILLSSKNTSNSFQQNIEQKSLIFQAATKI